LTTGLCFSGFDRERSKVCVLAIHRIRVLATPGKRDPIQGHRNRPIRWPSTMFIYRFTKMPRAQPLVAMKIEIAPASASS
jgi:hypothetical protein